MSTDVVMLGPPGSGKSTQAEQLARDLGLVHINPGTLLREIAAEDSALGQRVRDLIAEGKLVPDELTDELVRRRLRSVPPGQGVVLDGYPRTAAQAEALRRMLADSGRLRERPAVLRLEVPRDELLDRLRRRRDREGRSDDTDRAIGRRLQIYDSETAPLVEALSDWAEVVPIDGARPVGAVRRELRERVRTARRPPGRRRGGSGSRA